MPTGTSNDKPGTLECDNIQTQQQKYILSTPPDRRYLGHLKLLAQVETTAPLRQSLAWGEVSREDFWAVLGWDVGVGKGTGTPARTTVFSGDGAAYNRLLGT